MANTNWNLYSPPVLPYSVGTTNGTFWVAMKDADNTVVARSITTYCGITTTTTTAAPTTTTTTLALHFNYASGAGVNACSNWNTNTNPSTNIAFVGGSSDLCTSTSFTSNITIGDGTYYASDGNFFRQFSAVSNVFTFTAACTTCI